MRWPWSSSSDRESESQNDPHKRPAYIPPPSEKEKDKPHKPVDWNRSINAFDWEQLKQPGVIIHSIIFTGATLLLIHAYKTWLRRIPSSAHIKPESFRKRSVFGQVTSVGDGDNFRMFHTPGGRLTGWGWFPGRKVPSKKADLMAKTVRFWVP